MVFFLCVTVDFVSIMCIFASLLTLKYFNIMSKKSEIRQAIEKIINDQKFRVYVDSTNWSKVRGTAKATTNYRIKLAFTTPATPKQVEQLLELPHVYRVGYTHKNAWTEGITIYMDCKPSRVTLLNRFL